jgi:hypothetical protein
MKRRLACPQHAVDIEALATHSGDRVASVQALDVRKQACRGLLEPTPR